MSREALESAFGIAHSLVQRLFAEATKIIADSFHLFEADDSLHQRLENVAATPAFWTVRAAIQNAGTKNAE